jgi:hypothetical protein
MSPQLHPCFLSPVLLLPYICVADRGRWLQALLLVQNADEQ